MLLAQGWTNKSMKQKREPKKRLELYRTLVYDQKTLPICRRKGWNIQKWSLEKLFIWKINKIRLDLTPYTEVKLR